jgi:aspartyl-tRNA(Asn)/glutamyl-tRNA(Gln) amidotransferase subunit B
VVQETRLYDSDRDETRSMRSKEEANDYRYFPDPDLLPVVLEEGFIEAIKKTLPELPDARRQRFIEQFSLSDYDASILTASREMANYFETAVKLSCSEAKLCANWMIGELSAALNRDGKAINESPVSAEMLAGLLKRIADNTISGKIAKEIFTAMWEGEGDADTVIEKKGLKQITDGSAIESIIDEVIANNPQQVENYRNADEQKRGKMVGFFVGQVMKATQGKANPGQVNQLLKQKLD